MKRHLLMAAVLAAAVLPLLSAAPAQAQATRTWVSGVGDDANPCSRTAPCKTYAGAISKTAPGGEINCLDPGGFGTLNITKSISVVCDYTEGGVLAANVNGFIVNAPAGSVVTLKGQDVECVGTTAGQGMRIIGSGVTVHVHKSQFRNCGRQGRNGITVDPSSGTTKVLIADTYLTGNGDSATTGAILVRPTGSASVVLTVNRTQLEGNSAGVRIDSSATTGSVLGTIRDSGVFNNVNNGITAFSGAAASVATLMVDHVGVAGNAFGLVVNGGNSTLLVNRTSVTANGTGVLVNGSGQLRSFRTNVVEGNTIDGVFSSTTDTE